MKLRHLFIIAPCFACSVIAQEVDLAKAIADTQQDIATATRELATQRDTLAAKRLPLSQKRTELEHEVRRLRSDAHRIRTAREQGHGQVEALKTETRRLDEELNFIATALTEYRRSMETRTHVAEVQGVRGTFRSIDQLLASEDNAGLAKAANQLTQLSTSLRNGMEGGARFRGKCLDASGRERAGQFVVIGPAAYFSDNEGTFAGMVTADLGQQLPTLHPASPPDAREAIRRLASGQSAVVPIDLTNGDAMRVAQAKISWLDRAKKGGYTMIPLLAVAGLSTILALWKCLSLAGIRARAPKEIEAILAALQNKDRDAAEKQAANIRAPLRPIIDAGIAYAEAPREHLEEIMHERMLSVIPSLDRHLGILAVLGGIAPLLGLLGTVTGMIHTFQLVEIFGSGNAKLLSGGISEALVTTLFGLVIAIPVLLVHAFLARRVKTIISELEQTIVSFVNQLTIGETAP